MADAKVMPIRAVARRHAVAWSTVMELVRAWATLVAERRRPARVRVLLVDETSMRRRHRYVTVVENGETGEVAGDGRPPKCPRPARVLVGLPRANVGVEGSRWVVTDGSRA